MRLGERSGSSSRSSVEGHTGLCVPHLILPQARSAVIFPYLVILVPSTVYIIDPNLFHPPPTKRFLLPSPH